MNDYILEFENLTREINNFNMKLPYTVLASKILEVANINVTPVSNSINT